MSTSVKLAGFGAVLLALFGAAALAGSAIGPEPPENPQTAPTHSAPVEGDAVRGLAVAGGGLQLSLQQTELPRGRPATLRFGIVGDDGRRVRDFEVEHDRRMHLIVVRRDGQGFQHLHPELGADGIWSVRLNLPAAGAYRVFADFKRGGRPRTLAADLVVDGTADYRPLPAASATAEIADGYRVHLDAGRAGREADLSFTVTRDGETVRTEPYLGAGGHLVALREGDLAYLHVHPGGHGEGGSEHEAAVEFVSEFPSAGRYRLYLQFKHEGSVHTAEFTQEVGR